jgi:hypothetical protein
VKKVDDSEEQSEEDDVNEDEVKVKSKFHQQDKQTE